MRTIKEIEAMLDEKIPRSVVEQRDGGGGRSLSYLTAHYVIDRLNQVFGHMNWTKEIKEVKEVVNTTSRGQFPAYIVKVRLTVSIPGEEGSFTCVAKEAYGYGNDKSGQNAHELAIKEAVSDALKVAAKDFGMSMGLALYDKEQVNVEEEEPKPVTTTGGSIGAVTLKAVPNSTTVKAVPTTTTGAKATDTKEVKEGGVVPLTREQLLEATGSKAMVLEKVKGMTLDEIKAILAKQVGPGRSRKDLTVAELTTLDATFKELLA